MPSSTPASDPSTERDTPLRQVGRALLVVAVCTAAAWQLERWFDPINLILVYMGGVVLVALTSSRTASWTAIGLSIFAFDLIFVPPRWSLKPTDPQHYFTLLVMVVVGWLITELTERLHRQARRTAAAAVEAQTERLRNTLLSGLSHDFRTPLTTIVGATTSLLEQGAALDEPHRRGLLESVLREAQRMHATTSRLLDLTRLQEGAVQPRCEWCPADELVEEVVRAIGPRLAGHRLDVHTDAEAVVWCDPTLVEQALVNLLDNAARHTPPGGTIAVAIAIHGERWALTVQDSGPGVPAGEEERVFHKFYRAPGIGSQGESTGLGLALCAAIARLHGGEIVVMNAPGARFTMTLPQPRLPTESLDR
jgi:two-component system sensor histidine kinase KdpD